MEKIIQKLRDLRDETPCDLDSEKHGMSMGTCVCEKFDEIIDELINYKN